MINFCTFQRIKKKAPGGGGGGGGGALGCLAAASGGSKLGSPESLRESLGVRAAYISWIVRGF